MTDALISRRDVPIAVRDHGGHGPRVLLIHGAGRSLADWSSLAPLLTLRHRLVSMDLRCHGHSGEGAWHWAAILDDVAAVVEHFRLERAAIVGHSLGGMIAALWTAEHPECPLGINLDGHGLGTPDLYDGYDIDEALRLRDRLEAKSNEMSAAMRTGIPFDQLDLIIQAQTDSTATQGIDPAQLDESFRRQLKIENGVATPRPSTEQTDELMAAVKSLDLLDLYAKTQAPLLVVNCLQPGPEATAIGEPWIADFMAAYRRGLHNALSELTRREPLLSYAEFDGDHGLILNQSGKVAGIVEEALAKAGSP